MTDRIFAALIALFLAAIVGPFSAPKNDLQTTIVSAHAAGSNAFVVRLNDGARFGTPSPSAPVRITVVRRSDSAVAHYLVTGVTGDTLTVSTVTTGPDASTDLAFAPGDALEVRVSAGYVQELQDALTALDASVVHTSTNETVGGTKTFSSPIVGSITGNAATVTNGVVTTGSYADPAWITGLSAAKVSTGTLPSGVLPSTAVTPGSYTATNLTVDATGRITAAANGSGGSSTGVPTGVVNVKTDYAAVGDGTTNDRVAIQNAAAAAIAAGKPLYFPPGTYLVTFSGLSGSSTAKVAVTGHLDVIGSGQARTKIQCGPNSPAAGNDYQLFVVSDNVKFSIRDIELAGPATVDTSTNPDVGTNGGTGTCATNAILCNDCTTEGSIRCTNVKFSGQWFMAIQMSTGAGTGHFELNLDRCDLAGYAQCVAFFGPDGADRAFHATDTRFRSSGIPAANNNGVNYGHTCYVHPNLSFDFRNCRWDSSVRYGLHYYSSGGRTNVAKYARLVGCYFGPGITEGILFADNGCPQMVGGKYEGAGNITANTQAQFVGVDFNPIGGVVSVAANGTMAFDGCRFGSRFQLSPSAGSYTLNGCVSLQGDPLPGSLFGTLAARPSAASAGSGAIYYATDTFDTYTSNGAAWTQVVGNCPITNNGATINVTGGRFRGNLGTAGSNSGVIHASGTTRVRGVLFDGRFGNTSHNAPIDLASAASGSVAVDGNVFNATGADPIWSPAATPAGTLRGAGNTFAAGTPNVATNAQFLAGRAGQAPSAVASASTITPDTLNYDTFHLSGTTQVNTIVPASTQAAKGFSGTIRLICDAAVPFGSGGNVSPRTTSARSAGDVVILTYDPAAALWYEPLTATGVPAGAAALASANVFTAGPQTVNLSGSHTTKGAVLRAVPTVTATVSNKQLTSNVATLTTTAAHGILVGETITVASVDATFNGSFTVASVPTTTTLTYAKTAADVASVASSGTITASQTGNLLELQAGTGTALTFVNSSGNVAVGTAAAPNTPLYVGSNINAVYQSFGSAGSEIFSIQNGKSLSGGARGFYGSSSAVGSMNFNGPVTMSPGVSNVFTDVITAQASTGPNVILQGVGAANVTSAIRGASGQTADLQQRQASNGTTIYSADDFLGRRVVGAGAPAPSIAAGTGAGTSPTVTLLAGSSDEAGVISIVTGTTPSATATLCTVTFSSPYATTSRAITVTPANAAAATAMSNGPLWEDQPSRLAASYVVKVGANALTATTTYLLNYQVR